MLQTSTPRIDLISFNARHAVIISAQESSAGVVYTYQFTLTLDTAAALVYDLTKLNVIIRPAAPNKTIPFNMTRMGAKAGLSILSSNEAATHADLIDAPFTPSKIPGGAIGKVARDRLIAKISKKFTKYAWDKNAGYGTKFHLVAIKKFGVTKHHRKTFSPIHNILSHN